MDAKEIAKEFGKDSAFYKDRFGVKCVQPSNTLISRKDLEKCLKAPISRSREVQSFEGVCSQGRSQAWMRLRSGIEHGLIIVPKDVELLNTLVNVRYTVTARGELKVLSKYDHLRIGVDLAKADDILAVYL